MKGSQGPKSESKKDNVVTDDQLPKEIENAFTPSDIVNRPTGIDFYNIYHVENCSV